MLLDGIRPVHKAFADEAPAALARLKQVAVSGGNIFEEVMETVKVWPGWAKHRV